jgi:hypothetical protein
LCYLCFLTQGKAWIACCELFFANQPRWAAVDGHDVTPISSYLKTFTKYLAEILLDVLTNFQWLIKLGLWPDNRMNFLWQQNVDHQGRHGSSMRALLSKNRGLPNDERKTTLVTWQW